MAVGPKWKRFERLVAAIHFAESKGAQIKWDDKIEGRQFDVTVRFKHGLHDYLTVIECKDKDSKVPVGDVDAFVTKSRDVKANHAVMVSSRGYQSGCIPVAERHGIRLLILSEASSAELGQLIKEVMPMLAIDQVRFERSDARGEYELEDVGGRLAWLMLQIKIWHKDRELSPHDLVSEWLSRPEPVFRSEQHVRLAFEGGATVEIPDEEPLNVAALKFRARVVDGYTLSGPNLDAHILASMHTDVELRDADGKVVHRVPLKDVPFGFATEMLPGKYYTDPKVNMNFYCEGIEGDVLHIMLVESYQHGMRIGAQFTADRDVQTNYVEIKDSKTIKRLEKIRAEMLAQVSGTKSP